jgi:hypothetical protein
VTDSFNKYTTLAAKQAASTPKNLLYENRVVKDDTLLTKNTMELQQMHHQAYESIAF